MKYAARTTTMKKESEKNILSNTDSEAVPM
jgi:hypothetical protein